MKTLRSIPLPLPPSGSISAAGEYVLRENADNLHHPFVVHFHNFSDGGYHSGGYFDNYEDALASLLKRSGEYRAHFGTIN